jgi:hypothetical protein
MLILLFSIIKFTFERSKNSEKSGFIWLFSENMLHLPQ